jgi:hypothetical protein
MRATRLKLARHIQMGREPHVTWLHFDSWRGGVDATTDSRSGPVVAVRVLLGTMTFGQVRCNLTPLCSHYRLRLAAPSTQCKPSAEHVLPTGSPPSPG